MEKEKRLELIEEARLLGMKSVTIEGVTYEFGVGPKISHPVPEIKAEDLVKPLSVLDDYSDDEILYWSSPYYDEIQAKKQLQQELSFEEKAKTA